MRGTSEAKKSDLTLIQKTAEPSSFEMQHSKSNSKIVYQTKKKDSSGRATHASQLSGEKTAEKLQLADTKKSQERMPIGPVVGVSPISPRSVRQNIILAQYNTENVLPIIE